MTTNTRLIIFCLALAFSGISTLAMGVEAKLKQSIDKRHSQVSNRVSSFASNLDRFFGSQKSFNETNTSNIQIYSALTLYDTGNLGGETKLRVKLVLPQLEKRMRLVIENVPDRNEDSITTVTTGDSRTVAGNYQEGTSALAFLRYIPKVPGLRTTFDIGLKFDSKVKLVSRVRISKKIQLSDWKFSPLQQIKWVTDEGYSSTTGLDFEKKLSSNWFFRFTNAVEWTETVGDFHLFNGPSWYQVISDKQAITYNFRVESTSNETCTINNYVFSVYFRQLVYENWFFLSLIPMMSFPEINDYQQTNAITIRFDAIFGNLDQVMSEYFSIW